MAEVIATGIYLQDQEYVPVDQECTPGRLGIHTNDIPGPRGRCPGLSGLGQLA